MKIYFWLLNLFGYFGLVFIFALQNVVVANGVCKISFAIYLAPIFDMDF